MSENPSRRINKVYIVLQLEYPEEGGAGGIYDSASVTYATLSKEKADDIERLWDIVQEEKHHSFENHKMEIALKELERKYHIHCWSGEDLRVEEIELK